MPTLQKEIETLLSKYTIQRRQITEGYKIIQLRQEYATMILDLIRKRVQAVL